MEISLGDMLEISPSCQNEFLKECRPISDRKMVLIGQQDSQQEISSNDDISISEIFESEDERFEQTDVVHRQWEKSLETPSIRKVMSTVGDDKKTLSAIDPGLDICMMHPMMVIRTGYTPNEQAGKQI